MKLIYKKQTGGSFLPLFADYLQVQGPGSIFESEQKSTSNTSSKTGGDKGKITEKDLFTMLKDVDGLPNEM